MATPSGVTLSTATATPEQLAHIGKLASELVSDGYRVGLGSGRAALSFVRELAARVAAEGPTITGVPTSIKTEELAQELGLPLATLDEIEEIATRLRFKTESGGGRGRPTLVRLPLFHDSLCSATPSVPRLPLFHDSLCSMTPPSISHPESL